MRASEPVSRRAHNPKSRAQLPGPLPISPNLATILANRALEQFGYVIFCFYDGPDPVPEVGDVLNREISGGQPGIGSVHGPFRVIAEATKEEYLEQRRFLGFREYHRPPVAYFKVVAE